MPPLASLLVAPASAGIVPKAAVVAAAAAAGALLALTKLQGEDVYKASHTWLFGQHDIKLCVAHKLLLH